MSIREVFSSMRKYPTLVITVIPHHWLYLNCWFMVGYNSGVSSLRIEGWNLFINWVFYDLGSSKVYLSITML